MYNTKSDQIDGVSLIAKMSEHRPSEPFVVIIFILLTMVLRGVVVLFVLPDSLMILASFMILLMVPFYSRKITYGLLSLSFFSAIANLVFQVMPNEETEHIKNSLIALFFMTFFILISAEFIYHVISHFQKVNCELEIAKHKAEAASDAKANFLANMSHEIRTPLSGIMGITQMRISNSKEREEKEQLSMILESSDKLLNIVNNVLDYSRIETGELTFSLHHFSLGNLLQELFREYSPLASSKGITLVVKDSGDIPQYLLSDRYKLRTVISNLLQNAIDYTDEGSVELIVKKLPSFGNCDEILFSVNDTGMGIDNYKLATILEAFEQGDSSLTKSKSGIGLGLAVSARMIEGMGGSLEIETEVGKGSTFSFIVASESGSEGELEGGTLYTQALEQSTSVKILLADDNKVNQTYMSHFLQKRNYEVVVVKNGSEAVEAFQNHRFAAILMDIQMPIMSGIDATTSIRQIEKERNLPQVPIIAVTASVTGDEVEKYKQNGINYFCPKPIDLPSLNALLNDIILSF